MHFPTRTRPSMTAGVFALTLLAAGCSSGSDNRAAPITAQPTPGVTAISTAATPAPSTQAPISTSDAAANQASLRNSMRKLWEDHITWTRLYIIAAEAASPDTDATAQRLLQNQTDIGNVIKPFYGDAAGAQLTTLLRDHILTAGDLITAAKAGDTATVATTKDKWYANADQIADFLSAANPVNWPAPEMRTMMHDHLDNTLAEAVDHLQGNYTADIADYDKVHDQILHMADMLTNGIIAQYPENFS
jgi:hypothetical protein